MRYEEPDDEEVEYKPEPRYVSDNTAFMRWSTELEEIHNVIDGDFLAENRHRVGDLNKFLPLSNIVNPHMIKLLRLRRMNMGMAKDAGLMDVADETMLDNLADCQTSRGIAGFYQNALITQKREWLDKSKEKEKGGIIKSLVRGKRDEERIETVSYTHLRAHET